MKAEAILPVELNDSIEDIIETRGQTSDETEETELLQVRPDYVWRESVDSVDDMLSLEDLSFLFNKASEKVQNCNFMSIEIGPFVQRFGADPEDFIRIGSIYGLDIDTVEVPFSHSGKCCWVKLNTYLNHGCDYVRSKILSSLGIIALRKLPFYVPEGVAEDFVETCRGIDGSAERINYEFLKIACYLHKLKDSDWHFFYFYDCLDFYGFCKSRFGFASTTTKNLLAIYDRFIISDCGEMPMLKEEFKDYGYSQLVELVSVDTVLLDEFSPDMTVKEIRKKKKECMRREKTVEQQIDDSVLVVKRATEITVPYSRVISLLRGIPNPYFDIFKEKQSARFDAYRRAIDDAVNTFKAMYEDCESGKE